MKVAFIYSSKDREIAVSEAFLAGVRALEDEALALPKEDFKTLPEADVYCVVGVKSLKLCELIKKHHKPFIYLDKGYLRHRIEGGMWEYWRVAVNDHHPTDYVGRAKHGPGRWMATSERRMLPLKPWRTNGENIVYAGSSEKYHAFAHLPHPTEYATEIIRQLKEITDRPIVYRPKPTWHEAEPIKGTRFSDGNRPISYELSNAWCLVTNGSNCSFDAVYSGIPCIVTGNAIARPISSVSLLDVDDPKLVSQGEKMQWLWNLAWCQFTEAEMEAGLAWHAIKPQLSGQVLNENTLERIVIEPTRPTKAHMKKMGLMDSSKKSKAEQRKTKPFTKTRVKIGEG